MILICGESLIDFVPVAHDGEVAYLPRAGGSPYNVAIGLGRLAVPVQFVGRISTDFFGRGLRDRLAANAVGLERVLTGDELTTLAIVHLAAGSEPEYGFYDDGTAARMLEPGDLGPLDDDVQAIHFGSISLVMEPGASALEAWMRREHGRRIVSLDPNVRPSLIPDRAAYLRRLAGWVALSDVVKVSRADLAWLHPDRSPEESARAWLDLGPELVVMTRGHDGALALGRSATAEVGGIAVTVADTVGAGDAFTSGLLGWLHREGALGRPALRALTDDRLAACLRFANAVASITCSRAGAEPPTLAEALVLASESA